MRYEFDELKSVFYNYEVGYLEGLQYALQLVRLDAMGRIHSSADELEKMILEAKSKVAEEAN